MGEHEHSWNLMVHLDGCHWYQTNYRCDCGATLVEGGERTADGWARMHMDGETCERCAELLAGAKPEFVREVHEPEATA